VQENQKKNTEEGVTAFPNPKRTPSVERTGLGASFHLPLFLAVVLLIPLADQLTKWLIVTRLSLHESIPVIDGLLRITRIHNSGIAFGFFPGLPKLFTGVTVLSMLVVLYFYLTIQPRTRLVAAGCALILGGAAGNLTDRIQYGYVVDFINFSFWPAFNVADSAVSVGVATLLVNFFLENKEAKAHASNPVENRLL
jgi:signal peptidase II